MAAEYWWWIAAGVLLVIESLVPGPLVCASLGVAAAVAGLVARIASEDWTAWVAFLVVLAAIFYLVRKQVLRLRNTKGFPLMSDALVGQDVLVTQTIDTETGKGYVRAKGEYWRATSSRHIEAGERVQVKQVKDNTVIVE